MSFACVCSQRSGESTWGRVAVTFGHTAIHARTCIRFRAKGYRRARRILYIINEYNNAFYPDAHRYHRYINEHALLPRRRSRVRRFFFENAFGRTGRRKARVRGSPIERLRWFRLFEYSLPHVCVQSAQLTVT